MTGGITSFMSAAFLVLVVLACICGSDAANKTDDNPSEELFENYQQELRKVMDDVFAKIPPSIMRKLQTAEISTTCSIGMLKMIRGIRNLEPWALRLIDASGKYPNGLLDGARVDLGAFDECLDTAVRDEFGRATSMGRYCSLKIYNNVGSALFDKVEPILEVVHPKLRTLREFFEIGWFPLLRMGICVLDDCDGNDLQALIDSVEPPFVDIKVVNCVTREPQPWTTAQKAILIFLATLATFITLCTVVNLAVTWRSQARQREGILCKFLRMFSVTSNTRELLQMPAVNSTEHTYRFLHGIRYLCMCSILFGHCIATFSDVWARYTNAIAVVESWTVVFIAASFNSVDTFFFLSGFLMCVTLTKYKKMPAVVLLVVIPLRLIRTLVPAFFVIMCIYLVPVMVTGPDLETFMGYFYTEISEHWWHLLLQVKNLYFLDHKTVIGHYWYLSTDFQAFLLSFPVYLLFRKRKSWAIATFSVMSLVSCGIATWQIAGTEVPPFVVIPPRTPLIGLQMLNDYYVLPFYHLVCYFSGCIVFFVTEDFNKLKPSKVLQVAVWGIAACFGLCAVFQKLPWYQQYTPTTELGKLCTAFFDRIVWAVFLSLLTLGCGSGRGGFVGQFLSWSPFVPLSRLSFGAYLIHIPFLLLLLSAKRERHYYSMFNQVSLFFVLFAWSMLLSYLVYVACEAPTAKLSKLLFEASSRRHQGPPRTEPDAPQRDPSHTVTKAKL